MFLNKTSRTIKSIYIHALIADNYGINKIKMCIADKENCIRIIWFLRKNALLDPVSIWIVA